MRRILTWFLSTVTVVVLMFGYQTSTSGALTAQSTVAPSDPVPGSRGSATTSGDARRPAGTSTTQGSGSGSGSATVTGSVVETQWGPVQVQLTTAQGSITNVTVLQHPSGNSRDQMINDYALPVLVQETLDAQSADIDMVSGATVTSTGYIGSLQSALDEARL